MITELLCDDCGATVQIDPGDNVVSAASSIGWCCKSAEIQVLNEKTGAFRVSSIDWTCARCMAFEERQGQSH